MLQLSFSKPPPSSEIRQKTKSWFMLFYCRWNCRVWQWMFSLGAIMLSHLIENDHFFQLFFHGSTWIHPFDANNRVINYRHHHHQDEWSQMLHLGRAQQDQFIVKSRKCKTAKVSQSKYLWHISVHCCCEQCCKLTQWAAMDCSDFSPTDATVFDLSVAGLAHLFTQVRQPAFYETQKVTCTSFHCQSIVLM